MNQRLKTFIKVRLSELSPRLSTKLSYRYSFGRKLDLHNPKTINEKIQWLKFNTYYHNPIVTQCSDKFAIREYLKNKNMAFLLPKFYGCYDSPDEIAWERLPNSFVVKCNHGCGYNLLISDKSKLNIPEAVAQLKKWMKEDYWKFGAETVYRDIKKKIIIEEYLGDDVAAMKFYCFNGEPKITYVSSAGAEGHKDEYLDYFEMNFQRQPYTLRGHKHTACEIAPPPNFDKMVEISRILSADFPFVRVDLYNIGGRIYISELTFLPTSGFMHIDPESVLLEWGDYLDINKSTVS